MGPKRVCVVVTCMGRLGHLQQTLPALIRNTSFEVQLVDYSCPEGSGDWASKTFPVDLDRGRLRVSRVVGQATFHKTRALNLGARAAIDAGATHLCFLDADTHVLPGFGRWLGDNLDEASVFISALTDAGRDVAEFYGFLVVRSRLFEQSGGYSEAFQGWGCEDLEMRLRLVLRHGERIREVPLRYLAYIQHSFDLRTVHYTTKDWSLSNSQHSVELNRLVLEWTGGSLVDIAGPARRVFMQNHPVIYAAGKRLQHFTSPAHSS